MTTETKKILFPRKGAIAFCRRGYLGLIISDEPREVTYPDGNTGLSWLGIQLTNKPPFSENYPGPTGFGTMWSSRYPQVICYVEDLISKFLPDAEYTLYEILKDQRNEELINELILSLQEKQNESESKQE